MLSLGSVDPVTRCFGSEAVVAIGERGSSNEACLSTGNWVKWRENEAEPEKCNFRQLFPRKYSFLRPLVHLSRDIAKRRGNVILFFAPLIHFSPPLIRLLTLSTRFSTRIFFPFFEATRFSFPFCRKSRGSMGRRCVKNLEKPEYSRRDTFRTSRC